MRGGGEGFLYLDLFSSGSCSFGLCLDSISFCLSALFDFVFVSVFSLSRSFSFFFSLLSFFFFSCVCAQPSYIRMTQLLSPPLQIPDEEREREKRLTEDQLVDILTIV